MAELNDLSTTTTTITSNVEGPLYVVQDGEVFHLFRDRHHANNFEYDGEVDEHRTTVPIAIISYHYPVPWLDYSAARKAQVWLREHVKTYFHRDVVFEANEAETTEKAARPWRRRMRYWRPGSPGGQARSNNMPATTKEHLTDLALHISGGAIIVGISLQIPHPWDLIFAITCGGLLRELAQAVKSNIIRAFQDMPTWGWWGHLEWLVWGLGGSAAVFINWVITNS